MDFRPNRDLARKVNNSPEIQRALLAAATRMVAGVAAATPADTGDTRATTHAEGGHRSADGRTAAARVVQSGAAVQQQFGNTRERTPARQFNRGAL